MEQPAPVTVLFVDDDPSTREIVSNATSGYGEFSVSLVSSISEAIGVLERTEVEYLIVTSSFVDNSDGELGDLLNGHEHVDPSPITTAINRGDTPEVTPGQNDSNCETNPAPDRFEDLLARTETLVGGSCIGYSFREHFESNHRAGRPSPEGDATPDDVARMNPRTGHSESLLVTLHKGTTQLMQAGTVDEIFTIVLDIVDDVLQLPAAGIYRWDTEAGALEPYATTDETEQLFGDLPTFTGPDSLAWDAFIDGEFRVHDNVSHNQNSYNPETVIESELIAPIGEHGLLITGATRSNAFAPVELRVVQTLAANAETALDMVTQKRQLTHQQEQIAEQNEQLETLKRINSVIRDVGRITVTSSTESEIDQLICEKLTEIEPYCFAWVGEDERETGLRPRQWSGTNGEFLDHVRETSTSSSEQSLPAERALSTGEVQVTQDVFPIESSSPWRKAALDRGFRSVVSLPLSYRETTYGVLEIYASEPHAFGDEERDALAELGEMIANAFNTIERKRALLSDARTELELRLSGEDDVFSRIARKIDSELALETVVSREDETWLVYLTATNVDPSPALSAIRGLTTVDSTQRIDGRTDADLFGIVLTEFELGEFLASHGVKLEDVRASPGETTVAVSVPEQKSVRTVVETCKEKYRSVELSRRSSSVDGDALGQQLTDAESLTEKQRRALEVALNEGFFEWPRDKTGEEIAELLDVTPPTFHRHVRMGMEALLRETLGSASRLN